MEREIAVEGGFNLRDLGGYETVHGDRVRWRRVLRSGHFNELSEEGRREVADLGIRTVVDLRETWEMEAMPSEWCRGRDVEIINAPRSLHEAFDNRKLLKWDEEQSLEDARKQRIDTYSRKPRQFAPAVQRLFQVLARDESYPVVFHCMTGKDRTGFIAAVLLEWLGVDRETAIEDYLFTTQVFERMPVERMQSILAHYGLKPGREQALQVLAEVRSEYLEASLDVIDRELGGLERYVSEVAGVPAEQRKAVRERLLETA